LAKQLKSKAMSHSIEACQHICISNLLHGLYILYPGVQEPSNLLQKPHLLIMHINTIHINTMKHCPAISAASQVLSYAEAPLALSDAASQYATNRATTQLRSQH
jgi:hypothetical protein